MIPAPVSSQRRCVQSVIIPSTGVPRAFSTSLGCECTVRYQREVKCFISAFAFTEVG